MTLSVEDFEMLAVDILASPHPLSLPVQCVGCPGTEPFSPADPVGTTLQGRQRTVGCNHGDRLNFIVSVFCAGVICDLLFRGLSSFPSSFFQKRKTKVF